MDVRVASDFVCTLGEGPVWDSRSETLFHVDALSGLVCRFNPRTGVTQTVQVGDGTQVVSMVMPCKSDPQKLLVTLYDELRLLNWETKDSSQIIDKSDPGPTSPARFNDAKCDSKGRLWAGTMGIETRPTVLEEHQGALYSLEHTTMKLKKHISGITLSNGIIWSLDNKTMYFVDSLPRKIYAFDFDSDNGVPSNQRVFIDFQSTPDYEKLGFPDGMTIDAEGKLWVACYEGGCILRIDPKTGSLLQKINIPARKTTSLCFGGADYDKLYVTTAWFGLTEEERAQEPQAGSTFCITGLGVKGIPPNFFSG